MKESYGEGLATHSDPESCGSGRKLTEIYRLEALTGAHVGLPLSRVTIIFQGADVFAITEGHILGAATARCPGALPGLKTQACMGNSSGENREVPGPPQADGAWGRVGKPKGPRR